MNPTTQHKRTEVARFVELEVIPEQAVQGLVVTGSVAQGRAQPDSDIDGVVFLDPFDLYALPAEFKWRADDRTFHGIFREVENAVQFDLKRLDLAEWSKPMQVWPEPLCAELSAGWLAYDRHGRIRALIAERTSYTDEIRRARLDEGLVRLDWLLQDPTPERAWATLGPAAAHDRLRAAYDYLAQALFAYNRRWRPWRSRELPDLLSLPWLPQQFGERQLLAANALSETEEGYGQRVAVLQRFFDELVTVCRQQGIYGPEAVGEAFIRQHAEPGRNWNMDEWNQKHRGKNR